MIKVGVVGLGSFGQFSLAAYESIPGLEITQKYDPNLPDLCTTDSYENLLTKIDWVIINSPHYFHYSQAKQALLANVNVFCEKPLTLRASEAQELYDLAKSRGLKLGCNHLLVFSKSYQDLKKAIDSDEKVVSISVGNRATEFEIKSDWFWDKEKSGGWFLTSEYHFLYVFNYLFGEGRVVSAREEKVGGKTREVSAAFVFGETNASIFHQLDTPADQVDCRVVVEFEKRKVEIRGWIPEAGANFDQEYLNLIKLAFEDALSGNNVVTAEQVVKTIELANQAQRYAESLDR